MTRVAYSYSLRQLDAAFVRKTDEGWRKVDTLAEADGVSLLCRTGLDDLTFVPGKHSHSIRVGKHMHGYVRDGRWAVDGEGPE